MTTWSSPLFFYFFVLKIVRMFYTGRGDDGKTSLFHCDQRLSKSSNIAEALGALDELNSFLGWCKTKSSPEIALWLENAQNDIFSVQAQVAGAEKNISASDVNKLEDWIDEIEHRLDPIKSFIIAGGSELSAMLDFARTLARRAERRVVTANEERVIETSPETLAYLNRLSSFLFALARLVNKEEGVIESGPVYN